MGNVLKFTVNWELSGRIEIEVIHSISRKAKNKKSVKSEEVYGKLSFICYIIIFYSMLFMPVRKEHIF
ncbi:hypothetical protein LIT38_21060 [Bacillus sp. CMF12]|uniref:hypothetical protein n=1 Tax=Bacillus sp. CMF12 TaxID=2884834 RepID=UPI00207A3E37|nr:hypothetical protein [Bacillus sp. CMF12]USK48998.1 hypothetical protein LIT38_21060 [Bacillus sp. CMF12]